MASTVYKLQERELIKPPKFLADNIHYETIMGSVSYGVSTDTSDMDICGFAIPPKEMIFPHLAGEIFGFGKQKARFEQYQQHHIKDPTCDRTYDVSIYNIVKYFQLVMENNPNMLDSLFTAQDCVLHITKIGQMVREKRHIFLHKGCWHKFKGYAYSQLHKMSSMERTGKRKEVVEVLGFDPKFAYHTVRLLSEVEQILEEGDLDLRRNREQLKAIRRGEMPEADIRKWAADKELALEKLYAESPLPWGPDERKIQDLLEACLEEHYGNLEGCVYHQDEALRVIKHVQELVAKF